MKRLHAEALILVLCHILMIQELDAESFKHITAVSRRSTTNNVDDADEIVPVV